MITLYIVAPTMAATNQSIIISTSCMFSSLTGAYYIQEYSRYKQSQQSRVHNGVVVYFWHMAIQDFLINQALKWKMKDVPEEQREMIMNLVKKNPDLFKKIGEEVDRRVKKGGEPQMKATMEVMKKYRAELAELAGK